MTLDEAIKHCEEVVEKNENKAQEWHKQTKNRVVNFCEKAIQAENDCIECADEHKQLAEWLKELKQFKEQEPCEDVVSREEAIRVLKENCSHWDTNVMLIDIATDLLKKLPSVTLTRKKGKWIKRNNDYFDWYECSECGYGSDGEMKYNRLCDVRTKFCPDCGSQNLKGEDKE